MRGGRNPDVFETTINTLVHMDAVELSWRSRVFNIHGGLRLRYGWDADPRRLADFIDRLIGVTLHYWYELRVHQGREMANALMPYWEREIHAVMERMEYEGRHRVPRYSDRTAEMLYAFNAGFGGPTEDPAAKAKARDLLISNLDETQAASFKKDGSFRMVGKDAKVYTIRTARSFNVEGPDGAKYCGQLKDTPVEDQMLAQKLLLEHEPEKFFKNANVSPAPGAMQERIRGREYDWSILSDPSRFA